MSLSEMGMREFAYIAVGGVAVLAMQGALAAFYILSNLRKVAKAARRQATADMAEDRIAALLEIQRTLH